MMGMPRGLAKLTSISNNIQARADWQRLSKAATESGYGDLVETYRPSDSAGWKRIDKCTAALRCAIAEKEGK